LLCAVVCLPERICFLCCPLFLFLLTLCSTGDPIELSIPMHLLLDQSPMDCWFNPALFDLIVGFYFLMDVLIHYIKKFNKFVVCSE
jgi:hypothetical protein